MNIGSRLAEIVSALEEVGLVFLVMGGHAVRYYGVDRNTIDYDLHLSLDHWDSLPERLQKSTLAQSTSFQEGPSWRPRSFRRFQIGRLADGREEWLEFGKGNHLLPPFADLYAGRELGSYGGRLIPFLALPDLIRSKETEREGDWQDIALLEEILDGRNLAEARERTSIVAACARLRSRKGFESALRSGILTESALIEEAFALASSPISRAFLAPFLPVGTLQEIEPGMIGEILAGPLRRVAPGSGRHLALVEAVRRLYKQAAMTADRADKVKALGS